MGRAARSREPLARPIVLLVVSSLLALAGNLVAASVEAGSKPWWYLLIGASALAVLIFGVYLLWRLRSPLSVDLAHTLIDKARPCKGLVVLVSPGPGSESAKSAILYHARILASLKKVWLVHSELSKADAFRIMGEITQECGFDGAFQTIPVSDREFGGHPEVVQEKIESEVFRKLPDAMEESDVIVDVTGGRKATTAGAFLAALPPGRRIEIVQPKETDERGRGTEADVPAEIVLEYLITRR